MTTMGVLKRTPLLYISHGGPNLLEDTGAPSLFYDRLGQYIKNKVKPTAIVIFSAHCKRVQIQYTVVDASPKPKLIYDFYGFPNRYYEQRWDHQGSPQLASRIVQLLKNANIPAQTTKRGIDHGTWVPLKRAMESTGGLPVVQVSLYQDENVDKYIAVGRALRSLRDENVLLIGSGAAIHNLRDMFSTMGNPVPPSYVTSFDEDLLKSLTKTPKSSVLDELRKLPQHPAFRRCHPTAEHFLPIYIVAGAAHLDMADQSDEIERIMSGTMGTVGWASFRFGGPTF
ncbi:hypothetical protein BZG36_00252 [Bifiguratus adelaidae]|uniref:Extradiol ring-cleavage dioxygenase class III enzyme subunit B domain-containing protein n=1 Tax=Bifiguratus adelaidae TaxID=1938954 RepID=A0A261Y8F2_9FUNG|nr:hypothetical protein BZG36_00252 [Bifiguratus adelaidae]